MTAPALSLQDVTCTFVSRDDPHQRYTAVRDVTLHIAPGEFVSVVGPTGCGKSTLLNVAAGLLAPSSGSVQVFGAPLAGVNARAGYMFQAESLMPWRTVEENVPLGPEFREEEPSVYKRISRFFLDVVKLLDFAGAQPHELSGGMKQKVAIARALANDPEVILMDEPFANLDAQTRLLMREELLRIWERDKKTVILVTHNIDEAVMLCDRIAVMSSRPALIKEIVTVDIPRPRTMKSMRDPDFAQCTEKIWNLLRYDVNAALQRNQM